MNNTVFIEGGYDANVLWEAKYKRQKDQGQYELIVVNDAGEELMEADDLLYYYNIAQEMTISGINDAIKYTSTSKQINLSEIKKELTEHRGIEYLQDVYLKDYPNLLDNPPTRQTCLDKKLIPSDEEVLIIEEAEDMILSQILYSITHHSQVGTVDHNEPILLKFLSNVKVVTEDKNGGFVNPRPLDLSRLPSYKLEGRNVSNILYRGFWGMSNELKDLAVEAGFSRDYAEVASAVEAGEFTAKSALSNVGYALYKEIYRGEEDDFSGYESTGNDFIKELLRDRVSLDENTFESESEFNYENIVLAVRNSIFSQFSENLNLDGTHESYKEFISKALTELSAEESDFILDSVDSSNKNLDMRIESLLNFEDDGVLEKYAATKMFTIFNRTNDEYLGEFTKEEDDLIVNVIGKKRFVKALENAFYNTIAYSKLDEDAFQILFDTLEGFGGMSAAYDFRKGVYERTKAIQVDLDELISSKRFPLGYDEGRNLMTLRTNLGVIGTVTIDEDYNNRGVEIDFNVDGGYEYTSLQIPFDDILEGKGFRELTYFVRNTQSELFFDEELSKYNYGIKEVTDENFEMATEILNIIGFKNKVLVESVFKYITSKMSNGLMQTPVEDDNIGVTDDGVFIQAEEAELNDSFTIEELFTNEDFLVAVDKFYIGKRYDRELQRTIYEYAKFFGGNTSMGLMMKSLIDLAVKNAEKDN